ncbi:hypothetical protein [Streptomyces sp. NPDC001089]
MTWISVATFVAVFVAVAGLCFGLPDRWICALLALATLAAGCQAAIRGSVLWATVFLVGGAALCGASGHAIVTSRRTRSPR